MPQGKEQLWSLVMALLVLAFGGWSASIAYTGNRISNLVERQRDELSLIRTQLAVMESKAAVSNRDADIALNVAQQHGEELDKIRTRILRLEGKK